MDPKDLKELDWPSQCLPPLDEPEPEPMTPFTPAQIEFIQELIVKAIHNLDIEVDIRDDGGWYSSGYRVKVLLEYRDPETYVSETIASGSDSFSLPSNNDNQ